MNKLDPQANALAQALCAVCAALRVYFRVDDIEGIPRGKREEIFFAILRAAAAESVGIAKEILEAAAEEPQAAQGKNRGAVNSAPEPQ